jgi:hypothetical protein
VAVLAVDADGEVAQAGHDAGQAAGADLPASSWKVRSRDVVSFFSMCQ